MCVSLSLFLLVAKSLKRYFDQYQKARNPDCDNLTFVWGALWFGNKDDGSSGDHAFCGGNMCSNSVQITALFVYSLILVVLIFNCYSVSFFNSTVQLLLPIRYNYYYDISLLSPSSQTPAKWRKHVPTHHLLGKYGS